MAQHRKNDRSTEHCNENTSLLKIGEIPDWIRNWILRYHGHSESLRHLRTDRHNEANSCLRNLFPNLHVKSG